MDKITKTQKTKKSIITNVPLIDDRQLRRHLYWKMI